MLGVGTRVRLKLDQGCHYQHAKGANGQVGTIVAVVTDALLAPTNAIPIDRGNLLTIETFAGHLYSVELNEPGSLEIELCAASELEPLPA